MTYHVFDTHAAEYDAWYDNEVGKAIFAMEVDCLKPLLSRYKEPYLEIGVGSGRFARALGIKFGVDPSPAMARIAESRGIQVTKVSGEALSFPDDGFGGILIALTLCFVKAPHVVLREAYRVLQPSGGLVLGLILRDSPWAKFYTSQGEKGHPIYRQARFFSKKDEVESLLQMCGFKVLEYRSTLFQPLGQSRYLIESPISGYQQSAGFVAILAAKHAT